MARPELNNSVTIADVKDFYWLKEELVAFCKSKGISTTGGKRELTERIIIYLQTGKIIRRVNKQKYISTFDWNKATLELSTKITDNYRNTENVRTFMTREIGLHFRFNVPFLNWTKQNVGKTMGDAIEEWKRIHELKRDKRFQSEIAPQFEYNTYIRSFLADNPDKTIREAICFWNLKRNQRGGMAYSPDDLQLSVDFENAE
jgi:hypothetical protein